MNGTNLTRRPLGSGGESVSEIGLGCWQFGGDFGPMEEATAMRIMEEAVSQGINFFDTANVYGGGKSEQLIGKFTKSTSAKIFVATKYGRGPDAFPDKYSRASMRSAIEASMQRLEVSSIELLQLHCIPTKVLEQGEVFDWLREFQSEGLINSFGASVESVAEGLICLKQPKLKSLQVIFNLFRQKPAWELLPMAAQAGVGIIVRLPLASGLLGGKFTSSTTFPSSDHRNYNANGEHFNVGETFAGLPFPKGVEIAEQLKTLIPSDIAMSTFALRWILDHSQVSVVIPGASSPNQVQQNVKASFLPAMPSSMHDQLRSFYLQSVAPWIRGPY